MGAANMPAGLKPIRATRPDGAPIFVIPDNLSARKGAEELQLHGHLCVSRLGSFSLMKA